MFLWGEENDAIFFLNPAHSLASCIIRSVNLKPQKHLTSEIQYGTFYFLKNSVIENESVWYLIEGIHMIHPFLPKLALRFLSAPCIIISHSPFLKLRHWKQDYQGVYGRLKNSLKNSLKSFPTMNWVEKCDKCTWTFLGTFKKGAVIWGFVVTIFQVAQPAFPITPLSQGLSTGWTNHKCDPHSRHRVLSLSLLPNHLNTESTLKCPRLLSF